MHTHLIATELSNLGFTTRITQTGVLVSLNRPVASMEVETALEQAFEGIEFKLYHVHRNMVHVVTEE
jgi:hypothetical protein